MRALVITPEIRDQIALVLLHAETRRVSLNHMLRIKDGLEQPPTLFDHALRIEIPDGFRCAFSIEEHPGGWCRHISVSVATPGRSPHSYALAMLLDEFGFTAAAVEFIKKAFEKNPGEFPDGVAVWLEEGYAVNVVEKISGA